MKTDFECIWTNPWFCYVHCEPIPDNPEAICGLLDDCEHGFDKWCGIYEPDDDRYCFNCGFDHGYLTEDED